MLTVGGSQQYVIAVTKSRVVGIEKGFFAACCCRGIMVPFDFLMSKIFGLKYEVALTYNVQEKE